MKKMTFAALLVSLSFVMSGCVVAMRAINMARADEAAQLMESTNKIERTFVLKFVDGNGKEVLMKTGSSGSGTVVDVSIDRESLVLTAGHVCDFPEELLEMVAAGVVELVEDSIAVVTFDGERLDASVVVSSMKPDVCVIKTKGIAGPVVQVASSLPKLGSVVVNAGCPLGFKGNRTLHVDEGRYEGVYEEDGTKYVMTSVPIAPGSSGSAVVHEGQIIGVVVMGTGVFQHLAISTHLDDVIVAVETARAIWGK